MHTQRILSVLVGFMVLACGGNGRVLVVKSEPADAEVCIKGKARSQYFSHAKSCIGTTPFEADRVEITEKDGDKRTVKFKDVESDKEGFYVVVSRQGYISQAVDVPKWEHFVQLKSESTAHQPVAQSAPQQATVATPAAEDKLPIHGSVKISSDPMGALVYINDALKGNTPFTYEGPAAPVRLKLELEGYANLEKTLSIDAGKSINVNFKMSPQASH